jgi:hypothetical protein
MFFLEEMTFFYENITRKLKEFLLLAYEPIYFLHCYMFLRGFHDAEYVWWRKKLEKSKVYYQSPPLFHCWCFSLKKKEK